MKSLCLAVMLMVSLPLFAQEIPAFRVISLSGEVLVDNTPAAFDQVVTPSSHAIEVKPGAYAGVLTSEGYTYTAYPGTYTVSEIVRRAKPITKRPVNDDRPLWWIPEISSGQNRTSSDSVFLRWTTLDAISSFRFLVTDVFGDKVFDTLLHKNSITLDLHPFFEKERGDLVLELKLSKKESASLMVKQLKPEERRKLEFDLARIKDHPNKNILTLAIFQLNDLLYDLALKANQLAGDLAKENIPEDLKNYTHQLKTRLQLGDN